MSMPAPSPNYAELGVTSNFSFLRGGAHAGELVETARKLGLAAIGIADRNTLAGVVRAHVAAKEHGMRLIVGARLSARSHRRAGLRGTPRPISSSWAAALPAFPPRAA